MRLPASAVLAALPRSANVSRPGMTRRRSRAVSFLASRREAPPMPFGLQRPLSRGKRAHLERLWQLVDVKAQTQRRFVARSLHELVAPGDLARGDARQET